VPPVFVKVGLCAIGEKDPPGFLRNRRSNGDAFASHNKAPIVGEDIETQFPLNAFPPPLTLWQRYKKYRGIKDTEEPLVLQPYHEDVSGKEPRYYQADAINHTIEAVAASQKRVLLVIATGTGKTYTTFQIIWRLWKAGAVKRALFLADRNILIDQALIFGDRGAQDALARAFWGCRQFL
jgi:type I restriction enzyme, R subunit